MTEQEKALELFYKYFNKVIHFPYIDTEDGNCIGTGYMTYLSAKECALIAVDGLIKETDSTKTKYWQKVKKEIEKL